jgi:phage terminase small subunit
MATRKKTLKEDKISKANRLEIFCLEYLIDFNATRAAKAAGYSKKTAYSQGQRLLKNVETQMTLAEKRKVIVERIEFTAENVLTELGKLAFVNIKDYVKHATDRWIFFKNIDEIPRDLAAAVEAIKQTDKGIEVKLYNKPKSLELALRHFGLLTDNLNVKGSMKQYLTIDKLLDAADKKKKKNGIKSKRPKRK